MKECDVTKVDTIVDLFQIPFEQRDDHWKQHFYDAVIDSSFACRDPQVFGDARGHFYETWHRERYCGHGIPRDFVQDNVSRSQQGILRGLHLQEPFGQGKLVHVLHGEVYDVAVDVRFGSPTFGRWVGETLSDQNHRQLYIPPGFAHGFCVLRDLFSPWD